MPTIRKILTSIALCLAAPGLSSCLVTHQRLYEQSFSYDGVWVEHPDTIYSVNGKKYIQGVRAQFVNERHDSYMGLEESIVGPSKWNWQKIKGSEGEIVYREVDNDGWFKENSDWVSLDVGNARTKKRKYPAPSIYVDKTRRCLTSRAIYGLPGAGLCLIPDVTGSVVIWTAFGTGMVIQGIVLLPVSYQQQQTEPVSGAKPVVE